MLASTGLDIVLLLYCLLFREKVCTGSKACKSEGIWGEKPLRVRAFILESIQLKKQKPSQR